MLSANPTPVTPPRVPLLDPRTGLITREWYLFFASMFRSATVAEADDNNLRPWYVDAVSATDVAEVSTSPDLTALTTQLNDLALAPAYTPQLLAPRYGSFYDTTTQTAAAINTAYAVTINTTDLSQGVYVGSPTSRVYVDRPGVYNIQFSAQLDNTSGGSHLVFIWLRVNGTDVPQTASQVRLKGTDGELVAAWNFMYKLNTGDYFELMWSVTDTAVQITAQAAAAPVPAIPSIILTVTDNIST